MPDHTLLINRKQLVKCLVLRRIRLKTGRKGKFPQPVYTVEKTYLYQVSDIENWVKRQIDAKSI